MSEKVQVPQDPSTSQTPDPPTPSALIDLPKQDSPPKDKHPPPHPRYLDNLALDENDDLRPLRE